MPVIKPHQQAYQKDQLNTIALPGASVYYIPQLFSEAEAEIYFDKLQHLKGWESRPIKVYGKPCHQKRHTLYFGEVGTNYRYSGIDNPGDGKIPDVLRDITRRSEALLRQHGILDPDQSFNYWLGNLYTDGNQYIGMHSDDEKGLSGPIASLSFGSNRYFDFKEKGGQSTRLRMELTSGSLLIMTGDTQQNYLHGVPVQKKIHQPRINLTLRIVDTT